MHGALGIPEVISFITNVLGANETSNVQKCFIILIWSNIPALSPQTAILQTYVSERYNKSAPVKDFSWDLAALNLGLIN